jgi:hypothetical protein
MKMKRGNRMGYVVDLDTVLEKMETQKEMMIKHLKGCVSVEQAMLTAESQFEKAIHLVKEESLKDKEDN